MVLTLKENNENLEEILNSLINQTFGDNDTYINLHLIEGDINEYRDKGSMYNYLTGCYTMYEDGILKCFIYTGNDSFVKFREFKTGDRIVIKEDGSKFLYTNRDFSDDKVFYCIKSGKRGYFTE